MITWYAQQQRASCVAACVRMVLSDLGQFLTEQQVRLKIGQEPTGLSFERAYVELHSDWNLLDLRDCLRAGDHPIVGIERRIFGHADASHAVVLTGFSSQAVQVCDPLGNAAGDIFNLPTFEAAWVDAGRHALILQSTIPL